MPRWMFVAGVLIAIAGWMTRNYAASMMDRALYMAPVRESERHLPPIPGYQPTSAPPSPRPPLWATSVWV